MVYVKAIIMDIRSVKGMNDVYPPEVFLWRQIESAVRTHLENFGYAEIKTPIVEPTSLFSRSVGDTTDIVQKEMYTFKDRNEESLTLRPEGTASVVRALVEHNILNNEPVQKLYYWGPMFRYERPQKGRYRQFHQYGVEVFGVTSAYIDAELIAMLVALYEKFQLKDLTVRLGSVGCDGCRPKYKDFILKALKPSMKILCPDCQKRLDKNPLRVFDCKNETCQEVAKALPSMLDFLCNPCQEHFNLVRDSLVSLKTHFVVDKTLVRGLDYYTQTVFEITTNQLGSQNAVGGGGRYDKLVEELGGAKTPAVGYAGGVERLVLLLQDKVQDAIPALKLFVVTPDEKGLRWAYPVVQELRQKNIQVEVDYTGRSMKSQMKLADRLKAQNVLIVGGSELDKGEIILRNMSTKQQETIALNNAVSELLRRLS